MLAILVELLENDASERVFDTLALKDYSLFANTNHIFGFNKA